MTNRELLKEIKDIKKQFLRAEENVTYDEQAEELQEIFEKQEELQAEIARLEGKLENPSETYLIYSVKDAEEHLNKIQEHLDEIEVEERTYDAELARMNHRLQLLNSEIEASQDLEELGRLDEERYQQANTEDKTAEEITDIEEKIQLTRNAVVDLSAYAETLTVERDQLLQSIQNMETRKSHLEESKARYQALYERIEPTVKEGEILDNDQLEKDQMALEQNRQALAAYDAKEAYLSFNCANALESLEDDIKEGTLDKETIIARLQMIQDRAPFLPTDVPEEVEKNKVAQAKYQEQIETLKGKLENEENYLVSSTEFELLNKDIISLEIKQSDYDARIKENRDLFTKKMFEKDRTERAIAKTENEINTLDLQMAKLTFYMDHAASKKEKRFLENNLRSYRKLKVELPKILTELYERNADIAQQLTVIKKEEKRLPKMQDSITKLLNQKRERLENKTNIDEYAKRMDEDELHDLTSGLAALQAREAYLSANLPDKFEVLITKLKENELTSKKEQVKKGIVAFFEKANKKVVETISTKQFKERIKAFLGATLIVTTFASGLALLTKKTAKVERGGLSNQTVKTKLPDEIAKKDIFQIQFGDKTFDVIENEKNPNLDEKDETVKKPIDEVVQEVISGKWGNGSDRKDNLLKAGYTEQECDEIQAKVNAYFEKQTVPSKPADSKPIVSEPEVPQTPVPTETPTKPVENEPIKITPIAPRPDDRQEVIEKPVYRPSYSTTVTTKPTKEYTVDEGETLLVRTPQGTVAVDNSDDKNKQDVEPGTTFDYTSSSAIKKVEQDDKDSSIEVTVDPSQEAQETPTQEELNQQILDDYEKILQEMGISTDGRSR